MVDMLRDTPGFSSLELDIDTGAIWLLAYHDFEEYSLNDVNLEVVLHESEPNCAIKKAVEAWG